MELDTFGSSFFAHHFISPAFVCVRAIFADNFLPLFLCCCLLLTKLRWETLLEQNWVLGHKGLRSWLCFFSPDYIFLAFWQHYWYIPNYNRFMLEHHPSDLRNNKPGEEQGNWAFVIRTLSSYLYISIIKFFSDLFYLDGVGQ